MSSNLPIGIIDSGLGGLSVLRELLKIMPNENYIFFGDSANNPYGTKSVEKVVELTVSNANKLYDMGVKAMVIACNTATAVGAPVLRATYPDRIIVGIEPALKPAVLSKSNPTVLVMATPLTLQQDKFLSLMKRYTEDANIIPLPCPGLPELIEAGNFCGREIESYLERLFAPFDKSKIDSIVLGCTHYPLIKEQIAKSWGQAVDIFDGSEGTARHTRNLLKEADLLNEDNQAGKVTLLNSLDSDKIKELEQKILFG
ncbi:MAG: glutamate racemase [Clostridia bacterium]|nr:glutamate racemase [Clostridia bacterium]